MVDFAGWELPVQYSSALKEHQAVREAAGVFDVSHMGQVEIKGPDALAFVQNVGLLFEAYGADVDVDDDDDFEGFAYRNFAATAGVIWRS